MVFLSGRAREISTRSPKAARSRPQKAGGGAENELAKPRVVPRLPRRTDLVVSALDHESGPLQLDHDLVAEVTEVVVRRDREVPALVLHLVAAVVVLGAAVPGSRLGVDVVEAAVREIGRASCRERV